jgi:outer membrane protein, heavy metal efflux system
MVLRNLTSACIVIAVLLAGCATFRPKPISPDQQASAFEARKLDNAALKEFLTANLGHEITPWPPKSWDVRMLTLAAFYYNPDLDVARAQWGAAEAGVITAGGRPNPSAGLVPEFVSNAASGVSPWILGFTFDIPIETASKRGYRIAQAKHLSEAARVNIATVAWQVRSRLRARLLDLYAATQKETLLEKQQKDQEEIVKLLEQRLEVGEASQPDVTQARISLQQTRLALREAHKQAVEARAQVASALGLPTEALNGVDVSLAAFSRIPTMSELPPEKVRREALFNRPDILRALAEYAGSQSSLQLEIAKQYPDIHLGPGYKWEQGDHKWSFGISLTLPVLNQNQGPIAEAEANRKQAATRFAALQAEVIGEIDRSLTAYGAALQKLATADALLAEQKKQLQSVEDLFKAGGSDRVALGGARLEIDTIELSRLEALVAVQQSLGLVEDSIHRPVERETPANLETNPRSEKEITK